MGPMMALVLLVGAIGTSRGQGQVPGQVQGQFPGQINPGLPFNNFQQFIGAGCTPAVIQQIQASCQQQAASCTSCSYCMPYMQCLSQGYRSKGCVGLSNNFCMSYNLNGQCNCQYPGNNGYPVFNGGRVVGWPGGQLPINPHFLPPYGNGGSMQWPGYLVQQRQQQLLWSLLQGLRQPNNFNNNFLTWLLQGQGQNNNIQQIIASLLGQGGHININNLIPGLTAGNGQLNDFIKRFIASLNDNGQLNINNDLWKNLIALLNGNGQVNNDNWKKLIESLNGNGQSYKGIEELIALLRGNGQIKGIEELIALLRGNGQPKGIEELIALLLGWNWNVPTTKASPITVVPTRYWTDLMDKSGKK